MSRSLMSLQSNPTRYTSLKRFLTTNPFTFKWNSRSPPIPTTMPTTSPDFVVHHPPRRPDVSQPSVILYGTIESSEPVPWRDQLVEALSDLPVTILNPFRHDWDSTWIEDKSCPKFKEQVEWEMDHAQVADVIVFYFGPDTLAPITFLELGMYAGSGKAIVCCSPDFAKRGNVQVVCERYHIQLTENLEGLHEGVRHRLQELIEKA